MKDLGSMLKVLFKATRKTPQPPYGTLLPSRNSCNKALIFRDYGGLHNPLI